MRPCICVAAASLAACQAAPDPRGVEDDETLVPIVAGGRGEARPDEARFVAGVRTLAGSAEAATQGNTRVIERVIAAVDALGVGRDDVRTLNVSLNRIDYGPDRGRFEANNQIEVRVRDVNKAGAAIGAATGAGANVLSGPSLRVADREAARRSAYVAAFKAARARADAYAEAAGLTVARVLAIRDVDAAPIPYAQDAAAYEAAPRPVAQTAAPEIRPGLETSEVRVRVDFALEPR